MTNYDIENRSSVKLRFFCQDGLVLAKIVLSHEPHFCQDVPAVNPCFLSILASMACPGGNNHTQHRTGASWQK